MADYETGQLTLSVPSEFDFTSPKVCDNCPGMGGNLILDYGGDTPSLLYKFVDPEFCKHFFFPNGYTYLIACASFGCFDNRCNVSASIGLYPSDNEEACICAAPYAGACQMWSYGASGFLTQRTAWTLDFTGYSSGLGAEYCDPSSYPATVGLSVT